MSSSFKDLRVWQDAMRLAKRIYEQTSGFPKHEMYGLTQQMRRAAVSIPSNIAEGKGHYTNREFSRFLLYARGSLLELETQVLIAEELKYVSEVDARGLQMLTCAVGKGLAGLINSLSNSIPCKRTDDQGPTTNSTEV